MDDFATPMPSAVQLERGEKRERSAATVRMRTATSKMRPPADSEDRLEDLEDIQRDDGAHQHQQEQEADLHHALLDPLR